MKSPSATRWSGHRAVFFLLLLAGIAARVAGAWCFRNNTNPDCGIVALMAKHIAEGKDFPVFFYGQAYMGSLEPATSALFIKLFGLSGFWVCMGTAFWGILALPLVYRWARDAAGPTPGLLALAYTAVGPYFFFMYQFAPRGGYTLTLFLGMLVVWLSCRWVVQAADGKPVRAGQYFFLGLVAGLAWWTNQLIVYALGTAVLILAGGLRRRLLGWRPVAGVAGFFLGGLPLWLWNVQNHWATFAFLDSPAQGRFSEGLKLFFGARLYDFMGFSGAAPAWALTLLLLHLVLLLAALGWLIAPARLRGTDGHQVYLAGALLFLLVTLVVFAKSHFSHVHTGRYLLPLVPAMAVVLAAGTRALLLRVPRWLATLPLLVVVAAQLPALRSLPAMNRKFAVHHARAQNLAEAMEQWDLHVAYTPFILHWLNFQLHERFAFVEVQDERYRPYALAAERSEHIAVLNNHGRVTDFLDAAGGRAETTLGPGFSLIHAFVPPPGGLRAVEPTQIARITTSSGADVRGVLTDHDTTTTWESTVAAGDEEWLEVRFRAPVTLAAVRMLGQGKYSYPPTWKLLVRTGDDSEWIPHGPDYHYSSYFWSGSRPYWGGAAARITFRCPPRQVTALRIVRTSNELKWHWALRELQVFASGPAAPPGDPKALRALLSREHISRLYCDRGPANHFKREGLDTPLEPGIFPAASMQQGEAMRFAPGTALLVRKEDTPTTLQELKRWDTPIRSQTLGPWQLLTYTGTAEQTPPLVWLGFGCLTGHTKTYANQLIAEGGVLKLWQAVQIYPGFITSLPDLPTRLKKAGAHQEARAAEELYARSPPLTQSLSVEFNGRVQLVGLTVPSSEAHPGGTFKVTYHWRCSPDFDPQPYALFVHMVGTNIVAQDDHALLANIDREDLSFQPREEVFLEHRAVRLPKNLPPGEYTLKIGLLHADSGIRLRPRTDLPTHDRAVTLPVTIRVTDT